MYLKHLLLSLFLLALVSPPAYPAQDEQQLSVEQFLNSFPWTKGPATGTLGQEAAISVPSGYLFLEAADTQRLMEAFGNLVGGRELGLIAPSSFLQPEANAWFVVFEFSDVGYVKDDDRDSLDPNAMLTSIKQGTEAGNRERQERGIAPMTIIGWHTKPHYDPQSNNLEWCISAESMGEPIVNYNTRILGRSGVMELTLVTDPSQLDSVLPAYRNLLGGFSYSPGQRYAEYREGDKIAQYGLAALVVGAATAGAVKLGLLGTIVIFFKKAWKLVVFGLIAIGALLKRLVLGRDRRAETGAE